MNHFDRLKEYNKLNDRYKLAYKLFMDDYCKVYGLSIIKKTNLMFNIAFRALSQYKED